MLPKSESKAHRSMRIANHAINNRFTLALAGFAFTPQVFRVHFRAICGSGIAFTAPTGSDKATNKNKKGEKSFSPFRSGTEPIR
jgi:hypothetical protein